MLITDKGNNLAKHEIVVTHLYVYYVDITNSQSFKNYSPPNHQTACMVYLQSISHHVLKKFICLLLYLSSSQCSWGVTEQGLLLADQMQPLDRTQSGSSGATLNLCGQINE